MAPENDGWLFIANIECEQAVRRKIKFNRQA
jgi:hypothetical protein